MTTDWNPILRGEFDQPYWDELQTFVAAERARHAVYPSHEEVFAALHLTPHAETRVVILGQDPYHGAGQAHGLAFSVQPGVRVPPSLVNIHKELLADVARSDSGSRQPRRPGRDKACCCSTPRSPCVPAPAASHQGKGWETFTDQVIRATNAKTDRVVFILWGASARRKKGLIDTSVHTVIESAHPSPLSAHNGFLGSRPFSRTNTALVEVGLEPIDWTV